MATLLVAMLLCLASQSCHSEPSSYFFASQADIDYSKRTADKQDLPYCFIYAIVQQDTILITQITTNGKPLRVTNDVTYIGTGVIDHYEFNGQYRGMLAIFIHFKTFKRAK